MPKKDIVSALVIGEVCAWLVLIIVKNITYSFSLWWLVPIALPIAFAAGMAVAYFISIKIAVIYQIAKFLVIGVLNTLVDMGILNLFILLTSISSGIFFGVFKSVSFIIASTNSYLLNKSWTFNKKENKGAKEIVQFFIVSGIGFAINVGVAYFIVSIMGPRASIAPKVWANVGAFAAAVAGMTWNFVGYKFLVFKS